MVAKSRGLLRMVGNSIVALIDRVAAWLDAQSGAPGLTVAVTHASVIRAAIVHAIDAEPRSFWVHPHDRRHFL